MTIFSVLPPSHSLLRHAHLHFYLELAKLGELFQSLFPGDHYHDCDALRAELYIFEAPEEKDLRLKYAHTRS